MNTMVFISQPMRGIDPEDIKSIQDNVYKEYQERHPGESTRLINPYREPDAQIEMSQIIGNHSVKLLGESIALLSYADVVVFAKNWENYPGCRIEHKVCRYYDIPIEYA